MRLLFGIGMFLVFSCLLIMGFMLCCDLNLFLILCCGKFRSIF